MIKRFHIKLITNTVISDRQPDQGLYHLRLIYDVSQDLKINTFIIGFLTFGVSDQQV